MRGPTAEGWSAGCANCGESAPTTHGEENVTEEETVTLSVDQLLAMTRQLATQLKNASEVVARLEVALAIAQANPEGEVGDKAMVRAYGYLEELSLMGAMS